MVVQISSIKLKRQDREGRVLMREGPWCGLLDRAEEGAGAAGVGLRGNTSATAPPVAATARWLITCRGREELQVDPCGRQDPAKRFLSVTTNRSSREKAFTSKWSLAGIQGGLDLVNIYLYIHKWKWGNLHMTTSMAGWLIEHHTTLVYTRRTGKVLINLEGEWWGGSHHTIVMIYSNHRLTNKCSMSGSDLYTIHHLVLLGPPN
jgi:hypothetical protein